MKILIFFGKIERLCREVMQRKVFGMFENLPDTSISFLSSSEKREKLALATICEKAQNRKTAKMVIMCF